MFKSELHLKYIFGTELFDLTEPLIYETWGGTIRETPIGFRTDGHSYPDKLKYILGNPVGSETLPAAINHDHDRRDPEIPDELADKWYSQAMSDLGWNFKDQKEKYGWMRAISRTFRRKRNYLGVRIGSFFNWFSKEGRRDKKYGKIKVTNNSD